MKNRIHFIYGVWPSKSILPFCKIISFCNNSEYHYLLSCFNDPNQGSWDENTLKILVFVWKDWNQEVGIRFGHCSHSDFPSLFLIFISLGISSWVFILRCVNTKIFMLPGGSSIPSIHKVAHRNIRKLIQLFVSPSPYLALPYFSKARHLQG